MTSYRYCPLSSSSHANSIYLETPHCKILIDAGLSGKKTKESLAALGVDVLDLDAILVTHEHGDHIKGLRVLAFKHKIPVFANSGTARGIVSTFGDCPTFKIFSTGESFDFKGLHVHPFSIQHDTLDPVAFTIQFDGLKLGFCTDLGRPTSLVRHALRHCDYLYLEANHDPEMVAMAPRPPTYKQRVLGGGGHLSNQAAGELIRDVHSPNLKHIYLAHLSEECNRPKLAKKTVENAMLIDTPVDVAKHREMSPPIIF